MPEQLPEQEAKRLILKTMAPHFPNEIKEYSFDKSYDSFLNLLDTAVKTTNARRYYWATTFIYTDPNINLYNRLLALQTRLTQAIIIPEKNEEKRKYAPTC